MKKVYTVKCNECGVVLPEKNINMLAEDYAQCDECYYRKNTQCEYCKDFIKNENINEVNVNEELYDVCQWCFENEDWDSKFSNNSLYEEYEETYDDYDDFEDEEEMEIEEDEEESTLFKPDGYVNESVIMSDVLNEEENM